MRICFVTGNSKKWEEAKAILPQTIDLIRQNVDLVEIQGSRHEISAYKCRQAAAIVNGPVITEDTSLGFGALKGLPGPYIKHFLEAVGLDGLNKLLDGFEDKTATAYCTLSYFDPAGMSEPIIFEGCTEGLIVSPQGPTNFGWDPVFLPTEHSSNKTFAEMALEEKNSVSHRYRAFRQLAEHLEKEAD
jgi:inosine triphosphate pyrophosphatase